MNSGPISSDPLDGGARAAEARISTLAEMLRNRARHSRNQTAYRFIWDDERETSLTFGQLDRRARAIAAELSQTVEPGQRALLVFPPGLGFIEAFFGCFYAGVLAVPATHPKPRRPMTRIATIADDCSASVVLTTRQTMDGLDLDCLPNALNLATWIAVDEIPVESAERFEPRTIAPDDIAFLQYTSGSTNVPKGVIITHANLMYNLEMLRVAFGIPRPDYGESSAITVSWLPAFHDMGLIGGILEALYVRNCAVLMSPASFLLRPERWLQAISNNRSSINGAPNFAFDQCVRKVPPQLLENLDLSCWRVAVCGAEPVRAETIERFVKKFSVCGFRAEAFYPCYGLAEATLLACGDDWKQRPRVIRVRRSQLLSESIAEPCEDEHDSRALVSCGMPILEEKMAILHPRTGVRCQEGEVGEIWLSGPNVSLGYWMRADSNQPPSTADLQELGEGPYVRTGDLGLRQDGHLFVTGRLKDLIVVRGRNYYSHDIELTVGQSHECLLPGAGAAFTVDHDCDSEQELVVVHEVDRAYRSTDLDEVLRAIGRSVVEEHDIYPDAIVLIRQASLPRTTSGKVQRHRCLAEYVEGKQKSLARWPKIPITNASGNSAPSSNGKKIRPASPLHDASRGRNGHAKPEVAKPGVTTNGAKSIEQIESHLLQWLSERCEVVEDQLEFDRPFAELGIDSLAAVELSHKLEEWSGVRITETVAWQYPTPAAIVRYLADEVSGTSSNQAPSNPSRDEIEPSEFERLLASVEQLSDKEAAALAEKDNPEKSV